MPIKLLSPADIAKLGSISTKTARLMIDTGVLKSVKVGKRKRVPEHVWNQYCEVKR